MGGFFSRFRRPVEKLDESEPQVGAGPEKLEGVDLSADGNDVAIESLELSHEGLDLEPDAAGTGGLTLTPAEPPPAGVVESIGVKYTMFKEDGTPVSADGASGAPDDLSGSDRTPPEAAGWPVKWYVPELDSDSSGVPPIPPDDPDETTTIEPIAEAKETTGAINFLAADQKTELFDDDDSDPDDLA